MHSMSYCSNLQYFDIAFIRENFKQELRGFLPLLSEIHSIKWILKLYDGVRRASPMKATLMGMKNSSKELSFELNAVGESCYSECRGIRNREISCGASLDPLKIFWTPLLRFSCATCTEEDELARITHRKHLLLPRTLSRESAC